MYVCFNMCAKPVCNYLVVNYFDLRRDIVEGCICVSFNTLMCLIHYYSFDVISSSNWFVYDVRANVTCTNITSPGNYTFVVYMSHLCVYFIIIHLM